MDVDDYVVDDESSPLVSADDVFMPNPVKMVGVEDYYAARESLSWTSSVDLWPDVSKTDWVVLSGDATLISDTGVVAVVKEDDTTVTVKGGNNMIFADVSSLTVNQAGGVSEVYYDPLSELELNINVVGGVASLSKLSPDFTGLVEGVNDDGSRTIISNKTKITYNTGETGNVYLSDLVTGEVRKAVPTNTLKAPGVGEVSNDVVANDNQTNGVENIAPADEGENVGVRFENRPVSLDEVYEWSSFRDLEPVQTADPIEEVTDLFEDDVVIPDSFTEVVEDYFKVPNAGDWETRSDSYVSASDDKIELAFTKQIDKVEINRATQTYNQKTDDAVDDVLAMQSWDDIIIDDLMDLFYEV